MLASAPGNTPDSPRGPDGSLGSRARDVRPASYQPLVPLPSLDLVTGALVGAALAVAGALVPAILLKPPVFDIPPLPAAWVPPVQPDLPGDEGNSPFELAPDAASAESQVERGDGSDSVLLDPSRVQTHGVDVDKVVASLKLLEGRLRACRDTSASEDASVTGELMLRLSLGADGSVSDATVFEDSGQAPSLKSCLVRELKAAKIVPAPGHAATVMVPYWFD